MFFINSLFNLLEKITEYALDELYDEKEIKRKIMELAVQYELHEIDEFEYDTMEIKLLAQLREAREYHARLEEEDEEDEAEEDAIEVEYKEVVEDDEGENTDTVDTAEENRDE